MCSSMSVCVLIKLSVYIGVYMYSNVCLRGGQIVTAVFERIVTVIELMLPLAFDDWLQSILAS